MSETESTTPVDRDPQTARTIPLSDLAMAAFCPRKLYYARETDRSPPPEQETAIALSHAYPAILDSGDPQSELSELSDLATEDPEAASTLHVPPARLVRNLQRQRERLDQWDSLANPPERDVFLQGKDVHGNAAKVLQDPAAPTIVSPGEPPPEGVWQPQSVRAVGAAKALAWELEEPVERAYVEYPLHGTIRRVDLTTRRMAVYRRTLRSVRAMDGPPPRLGTDAKCQSCRFVEKCGVRTRSLRSLL